MWHLHVSSNGDSCSQFLIGWPQWSRVSLIRKSEFVFINWVHFCSFFSAFFKYQSGNHVLPLPLLKLWWFHLNWEICYTCMYEFILIYQMCMTMCYQVSLNCRPRFYKGNFKKKLFPFDLLWRLKTWKNKSIQVSMCKLCQLLS